MPNETKPDKCQEHDEDCPFFDTHEYCSKCACGDNHDHNENETKPERTEKKELPIKLVKRGANIGWWLVIDNDTPCGITIGEISSLQLYGDRIVETYNSHDALTADKERLEKKLKLATDGLERLGSSEAFGMPFAIPNDTVGKELKARLDYAQKIQITVDMKFDESIHEKVLIDTMERISESPCLSEYCGKSGKDCRCASCLAKIALRTVGEAGE